MASIAARSSKDSSISRGVQVPDGSQSKSSDLSLASSTCCLDPQSISDPQRRTHVLSTSVGTRLSISLVRVLRDDHVSNTDPKGSSIGEIREQVVQGSLVGSRHGHQRDLRRRIDGSFQGCQHSTPCSRWSI